MKHLTKLVKKYKNSSILLAAVITGVFTILAAIIKLGPSQQPSINQSNVNIINSQIHSEQCKITIRKLTINYHINDSLFFVSENQSIHAKIYDTLNLINFELDLLPEQNCQKVSIMADAYIRKPDIENRDPNDKYDYHDGRFTNAAMPIRLFKSSDFLTENKEIKGWENG